MYQPAGRVPELLTSPFPHLFQTPEHPDSYLPDHITAAELKANGYAKMIEWKARSSVNDIVTGNILPRMTNTHTNTKRYASTLNKAEQDWRVRRGMFTRLCGRERKQKKSAKTSVPLQARAVFNSLHDLQLIYVSKLLTLLIEDLLTLTSSGRLESLTSHAWCQLSVESTIPFVVHLSYRSIHKLRFNR
jgi:hypothetical protein